MCSRDAACRVSLDTPRLRSPRETGQASSRPVKHYFTITFTVAVVRPYWFVE
jgi:hypothetical protein